jgi:hypothetical protein
MADISSDADLRAHIRSELGLTNAGRVSDEDMAAEINSAKAQLSREVANRVNEGQVLNFYNSQAEAVLENFLKIRFSALSPGHNGNAGKRRIPKDHPASVSHIRHTDFGDDQVNFWRDRMVRAFNRI